MFIRQYFAAWAADWTGRMSGFASVVLTFWITFFPPTLTAARWTLLITAIVCFVLGSYHIWARERRALLAEVGKALKSRFDNSTMAQCRFVTVGGEVFAAFYVEIRNSGEPSIAEGFFLTITLLDGRKVSPPLALIMKDVKADDGSVYKREDLLLDKVSHTPIPTGGRVSGMLYYVISNATVEEILQEGVDLSLMFFDIHRNPYHIKTKLTPGDATLGVGMPGLQSVWGKPMLLGGSKTTRKTRKGRRRN